MAKQKWQFTLDELLDKALKPALYGMDVPGVPEKFDPAFWREWTGLPWEWDYRRLHSPPLTRQDQADMMKKVGGFLGPKAFNVYGTLYVAACETEKDGRWVQVDYMRLAKQALVSRKVAVKHVMRLRHCNLIRLLEPGVHGLGNVYYVPPITPPLLWAAEMHWFRLSRKERRALRSKDILKNRHT